MKPFFAEQITESPRHNGRWQQKEAKKAGRAVVRKRGRGRLQADDSEPGEDHLGKFRMTKNKGSKDFTDLLGPLRRYLRKSVGRPWDDVYSEISEHIPANSMQGRHIRQHVEQFVEQNVVMVEGRPHSQKTYGGPLVMLMSSGRSPNQFYVHPVTQKMERVEATRGQYRTPDGRTLCLDTWAKQHFGKPVEQVKAILTCAKDGSGQHPKPETVERAMNKVGGPNTAGFFIAFRSASERAAERRRNKQAEQQAKAAAALVALKKADQKRNLAKKNALEQKP